MTRAGSLLVMALVLAIAPGLRTQYAFAEEPAVLAPGEVVNWGEDRDGEEVTLRGEALGEVLRAVGPGAWVNVLGGGAAIGLWSQKRSTFAPVREFGFYGQRGAVVEATGTFNAACDQHGGDRDVHVRSLRVVEPGVALERPVRFWKLGIAAVFAGAGLALRFRAKRAYRDY